MEELKQLLQEQLNQELSLIIISNPRSGQSVSKIKIRPVLLKEQLYFQAEQAVGPKVFHENWKAADLQQQILSWMQLSFKQLQLESRTVSATALVSKKGKVTLKKKQQTCCVK